ncbi:MAG: aldo/keto reductase [Oscillospiraceae bacterium]|jgi:predicted oxidoreductase|nr:aldo/keto reductase [Oscillospiraceae bacterium]
MEKITLGKSNLETPRIAVGCMRIYGMDKKSAESFINGAMELGANFFDHADIYGRGACESVFADAVSMTPSVREKMILQSKCGIVPGKMFDFSKRHILESVDGILSRLKTDYLDVLLLHRPDALCEPEEVAAAFDELYRSGKVRNFGVSNHNPMQMELLQRYLTRPILANQLQLSIAHAPMITNGINVNMMSDAAAGRDGSVLDYCRLKDITIQAWSPFQYGTFAGVFLGSKDFPALNAKLDELAAKYSVSNTTIAAAWILRHPARMQVVTGTTKLERLKDCVKAAEISLTREEWYEIYLAAGYILP